MEEHTKCNVLKFKPANDRLVRDQCKDTRNKKRILLSIENRLIKQTYGNMLDAERDRQNQIILQFILDEARHGRLYTNKTFSEIFEGKKGLMGINSILKRLSVLATKGYIKFIKNPSALRLPKAQSTCSFLCVQGMVFVDDKGIKHQVFSSHYKCSGTGAELPINGPHAWPLKDNTNFKNF